MIGAPQGYDRCVQLVAKCPKCDAGLPVRADEAPSAIKCGRCGREIALTFTDALRDDRAVDRCPVCGGADFYIRKDFDPKVGLTVVIIGALVSAGFYWFGRDLIAYSILASAALIDLAVYGRLKDVTVCYRCHSEFRGSYQRTAAAFDLHTADVLELEYERKIGRR
jgi:DNA-directed RNA polymerase subunit RPC12/RpoP